MDASNVPALEKLAAELGARGFEARLITPAGKEPWLTVRNPRGPLTETVMVAGGWFWWPWADRITTVDDAPGAAAKVASVLCMAGGNGNG